MPNLLESLQRHYPEFRQHLSLFEPGRFHGQSLSALVDGDADAIAVEGVFAAAAADIECVSGLMDAGWDVGVSTTHLVEELQQAVAAAIFSSFARGLWMGQRGLVTFPAQSSQPANGAGERFPAAPED